MYYVFTVLFRMENGELDVMGDILPDELIQMINNGDVVSFTRHQVTRDEFIKVMLRNQLEAQDELFRVFDDWDMLPTLVDVLVTRNMEYADW